MSNFSDLIRSALILTRELCLAHRTTGCFTTAITARLAASQIACHTRPPTNVPATSRGCTMSGDLADAFVEVLLPHLGFFSCSSRNVHTCSVGVRPVWAPEPHLHGLRATFPDLNMTAGTHGVVMAKAKTTTSYYKSKNAAHIVSPLL